ncbi:MAG: nucleoside recognition protein, partial [Bilophila sp.]
QTTTLATMMLIAHSLPAEGRIAQQCGVSFLSQTVIRLVVAVAAGMLVHTSCLAFGWLDTPATIVFQASAPEPDLVKWGLGELRNLASIFCIIFAVMLLQRALKFFRISDLLGVVLKPFLRLLGLSSTAATTIVIGLVTGIIYGSGTIIKEAKSGTLTHHEIFTCVTLMGLSHALIEDTLLMSLIGAHLGGILFLRLGLSLLVCASLNALYVRKKNRQTA